MSKENHYQTLGINPKASQTEVKSAYRNLVKQFHPDTQTSDANHETIISINAAYEILGDPQKRQKYDRQLQQSDRREVYTHREQKNTRVQKDYQRQRANEKQADLHLSRWIQQVYLPVNDWLSLILDPLEKQIDNLAGDPFDDDLMRDFQAYISQSRHYLVKARLCLHHQPNPPKLAKIAANLYYCLNQITDGIDELDLFTQNYCESYLHTGQELFRIARNLRAEANDAAQNLI